MTIARLIKELQKIQAAHGSRTKVTVSKDGMKNLDNPDYSHITVQSVMPEAIVWNVDDNPYLADGSERIRVTAVINGE